MGLGPKILAGFLDTHDVTHHPVTARDVVDARGLRDELVALFALDTDADVLAAVSAVLAP